MSSEAIPKQCSADILLHIPVDKPTLLNQCGTFSIVYPPTVKLEEDQGQDELENESRWNTYEWMVGLLRGIIKRPTEMKNGNFTCASSLTRDSPNFGVWVDDFFSFYSGKNGQAHNVWSYARRRMPLYSLDLQPTPLLLCEICARMTKKADPNVKKYGNPTPTVLSRNSKGQFVALAPSLTKKKALERKYSRRKRRAVSYYFTRQEHSFIKNVAYKIGVSLQAFCASASI